MEPTLQITEFGKALLFFLAGAVFLVGGIVANRVLAPRRPNPEKLAPYECGEDPVGSAWVQFNMRFYLMGLVFLIFDVEVLLLFPWAVAMGDTDLLTRSAGWGWFALAEGVLFIAILALGLVHVWVRGDIDWVRPAPLAPNDNGTVPLKEYAAFNAGIVSGAGAAGNPSSGEGQ